MLNAQIPLLLLEIFRIELILILKRGQHGKYSCGSACSWLSFPALFKDLAISAGRRGPPSQAAIFIDALLVLSPLLTELFVFVSVASLSENLIMVGMEDLALIVKRLEIVTEKLEAVGDNVKGDGGRVSQEEKLNISVTAYDDIHNGVFKAFLGK